jgi:hypothetical protein
MTRAERRHHRYRIKRQRQHYRIAHDAKGASMAINTPHPCSCPLCCNQRKLIGDTLQEQRAVKRFLEWHD